MEAVISNAQTQDKSNKLPNQIKYIVGNEACERYSYYGMRSILTIFMMQYLMFEKSHATSTYHLFASACYLFPILGAFISDRFLGKYKTILYLSLVYCLGHLVLALFEGTATGMYWGLGLIAFGSGGIKPCVSAHVGDQFKANNKHLLNKVFDLFYFMINFGSFFSTMITPWTLKQYGPSIAFGIPGILMFLATFVFWLGRNQYVHVPPTGKISGKAGLLGYFDPNGLFGVLISACKNQGKKKPGSSWIDAALVKHSEKDVDAVKAVLGIGTVFSMISIFWALFDQHGSTWVVQAMQMNRSFMGMELEASQIAALNPIMVMGLIPLFSFWIYPFVNDKLKIKVTPLRKMSAGMFVAAFSFVFVAILQIFIDRGIQLNVMWQFFPYLIITVAEVLISITGLEFAYTQAPRAMKSTIMSMWLLTVFFGNLFTAYVEKINVFTGANQFFFYAGIMSVFALIFVWIAVNYKDRNYMEA